MKKSIGGGVVFGIIILYVFVLMLTNDFVNITRVEYQKYNHPEEKYGEVAVLEDEDSLSQLTKILNKADHERTDYEKADHEDVKLTLFYKEGTSEMIRIWKDFGQDYDLLERGTKEVVYKLKDKQARKMLNEMLSEITLQKQ
ncbi:hypothetical protein [Salirhabdus sp. Marseille-P4669]|uniref:hypothetical protein n=1 Tax=Salirhabdus sp. Marseille-P4669 TaxID=2042310 RepID=UPI000C7E11DA|nr:hypothetical protein [Salirhabdus sp. Marseille-P4669]